MKISQFKKQMFSVGDIVSDKLYGNGQIVSLEYDKDLNWFTYSVKTDFGIKKRQNDTLKLISYATV